MIPSFAYVEDGETHTVKLERFPNGEWVIIDTAMSKVNPIQGGRDEAIERYLTWIREILLDEIPRDDA